MSQSSTQKSFLKICFLQDESGGGNYDLLYQNTALSAKYGYIKYHDFFFFICVLKIKNRVKFPLFNINNT